MRQPRHTPGSSFGSFRSFGRVDAQQFRALLRAYSALNTRGQLSQLYGNQKKVGFKGFLLGYFVMGAFMGPSFLAMRADAFTFALLLHSMTFMMLLMGCIVESSQILFNPREPDILGHRPVSAATLISAKLVNMIGVMLLFALCFNFVPTVCFLAAAGVHLWGVMAHAVTVALSVIFCIGFVVLVYGLATRLVGRERFQLIVTWLQVVMMVVFLFGYQLIARALPRGSGLSLNWYHLASPPSWFAALDAALSTATFNSRSGILSLLGLLVPPIVLVIAVARFATMQSWIASGLIEQAAPTPGKAKQKPLPQARQGLLKRWWLRDPVERAIYRLVTAYMRHDRFTMQQLYSQIAFIIIYPLTLIVLDRHHGSMFFLGSATWTLALLAPMALDVLRYSNHNAATELFAVVPLANARQIFTATRKAVLYGLVLPCAIINLGIFLYLSSNRLQEFLICLPGLLLIPSISATVAVGKEPYLPFSRPPAIGRPQGRQALIFFSMIVIAAVIFISYLLSQFKMLYLIYLIEIPLLLVIQARQAQEIKNQPPIRIG